MTLSAYHFGMLARLTLAISLVGCSSATGEDLPLGDQSRLAFCEALATCKATDVAACAGLVEDAPTMTETHHARCVELVNALECSAPRDRGAWVSTRFACGL